MIKVKLALHEVKTDYNSYIWASFWYIRAATLCEIGYAYGGITSEDTQRVGTDHAGN